MKGVDTHETETLKEKLNDKVQNGYQTFIENLMDYLQIRLLAFL